MEQDEEQRSILEVLGELLKPLGERRQKRILAWVDREIKTHAIVQFVVEAGAPLLKDASGGETGGPQVWRIGEASPLNADEIIFAMFIDDAGVVTAYSFQSVEADGQTGVLFFRSLIFKPIHVHGPVHMNALMGELAGFIGDDDGKGAEDLGEGEDDQPNGRGASA